MADNQRDKSGQPNQQGGQGNQGNQQQDGGQQREARSAERSTLLGSFLLGSRAFLVALVAVA